MKDASGLWEKVCQRCGSWFAAPDIDMVQCPECARDLLLLDDDEATLADFESEYAEYLAAGWQRINTAGIADELRSMPHKERMRLLTNEWPEADPVWRD